jgi:hypothetical protein
MNLGVATYVTQIWFRYFIGIAMWKGYWCPFLGARKQNCNLSFVFHWGWSQFVELLIMMLQVIEERKFGDWFCCFVVCLCAWLQRFVQDGVGKSQDQNKKWVFFIAKHFIFLWQFAYLEMEFMFIVVISTVMVWEKCVTCGIWFLSVKAKNFSIAFSFSRKELGSKTVFRGRNQKNDEGCF